MSTSAGIICVDETGHTLIVQQYGKSWCFPKGRIEESDVTPLHAASREFREETGMVSVDDPITFGYNIVQDGTVFIKMHDYWDKTEYQPMPTAPARLEIRGFRQSDYHHEQTAATSAARPCQCHCHDIQYKGVECPVQNPH